MTNRDMTSHHVLVNFDLSWENSWRTSTLESNWDAAWIFIKWRKQGQNTWNHATLNTTGHTASSGSTITTPTDGKGVFIYKNADGIGSNNFTSTKLRWNYGTDGLVDNDLVEICVIGIEMVYIPQGSFYVGDGTTGGNIRGQFEDRVTGLPFQITSESLPSVLGGGTPGSMGNNNASGMNASGVDDFNDVMIKVLPLSFPKGYNAFYVMKYEVSQSQYVDFLNKLTYTQQARRVMISPNSAIGTRAFSVGEYRNSISIKSSGTNATTPAVFGCDLNRNINYEESNDGQNLPINWMHFADCQAYLDWSGLRPITELEFEKACRGNQTPVVSEYAWGNTTITSATSTGLSNAGTASEISSNSSSNCVYNAPIVTSNGPIRVGSFAQASTNRTQSGGSYYGVMDLSGNVREMTITIGNITGRSFTGLSGDGALDVNGEANTLNWPSGFQADVSVATGAGYRGNDWSEDTPIYLSVSCRVNAGYKYKWRDPDYGFRGGRTAP